MRRKLVCRIAARLPQTIDTSGSTASRSTSGLPIVALPKSRSTASSTPALISVAMYAVTGTLAASYASGAHVWKGTTAAFRKNATSTRITATLASVSRACAACTNASRASEPVDPYTSEAPMRNIAVAAPPSTRYFSAASAASCRWYAISTNTYTGIDMISRPRNIVRKPSAELTSSTP